MKKKIKSILVKFIGNGWHEIDCPAHSNNMQKEADCDCLYGFTIDLLEKEINSSPLNKVREKRTK